jgi:hypothetical protein
MSRTTDILLCVGSLDDERLDEFNAALVQAGFSASSNTPLLTSLSSALKELPGSKYYTDDVWAACWNFGLPKEELVPVFKAFPWYQPENALLIISEEQGDTEVLRP